MRYYKKMLLVLMTISASFVILLISVFLVNDITTERARFEENIRIHSYQLAEYTDIRLANSIQLSRLLTVSDQTNRYLRKTGNHQYNRFQLFTYFRTIIGTSSITHNAVALSTFDENNVMRGDGTGFVVTFLNMFGLTHDKLDEIIEGFEPTFRSQMTVVPVLTPEGERQYIIVHYEPVSMAIEASLYVFVSYTDSQFFAIDYISPDTGFALFYRNSLTAYEGVFTEEEIIAAKEDPVAAGISVNAVESSVPGFSYLYLSKPPGIMSSSFLLILFIGIFALTCVVLLMLRLAKQMYLPIKELLVLSGSDYAGDEFDYIKKSMLSIHTEMENINDTINNKLIERALYLDLFNGKPADDIERFIPNPRGPFVLVLLKLNQEEAEYDLPQNMVYLLHQKIEQYLYPITDNVPFSKSIDITFDIKALLLATDDVQKITDHLKDALLLAESDHNLDFTAVVGKSAEGLAHIPSSYSSARQRLLKTSDLDVKVINTDDPIKQSNNRLKKKTNPDITDKMINFIKENYTRDISLLDLAEHLKLSRNYVSVSFKNAVGSNFKDYLNHTRYIKSCELLNENPNQKLKDVATMVGCNKDILARLFIRYGNMLPSDYQKNVDKA